jgi:hypothetical protein
LGEFELGPKSMPADVHAAVPEPHDTDDFSTYRHRSLILAGDHLREIQDRLEELAKKLEKLLEDNPNGPRSN